MANQYTLEYLGKKLVRRNPELGIHRSHYMHVVEVKSDFTSPYEKLDQIMNLDAWCVEHFDQRAYSMDPNDDGEWFKFKVKTDAMQFKLANG